MAGGLGDVLGATFVMMPRVFADGVVVPPDSTPVVHTERLRGVPSLKPRRRPDVAEVSGVGLQPVIGAGTLTSEAAISGELRQTAEAYGHLDAEAALAAVLAIRSGAEAILAREWGINAMMLCAPRGIARLATDSAIAGVGAETAMFFGRMAVDQPIAGRLSVRTGAEAVMALEENDEQIVLALLGLPSEFIL